MKNLFPILLVILAFPASAQKIGGFYSGILRNDSAHMIQKYELALSEYRGKISGYSYVTFVANDTFYYGIRKIKAEIVGDSLVVSDDKMIVNNFPEKPAKGVGRTITIPLNGQDSLVSLNGTWKTNRTKKYYSVPGSIELNRSTDSASSPLIAHLMELNIIAQPNYQNIDPAADQKDLAQSKNESDREIKSKQKQEKEGEKVKLKSETTASTEKTGKKKEEETVSVKKPKENKIAKKEDSREVKTIQSVQSAPVKLAYNQRKNRDIQVLESKSDSLVLAFYDNGVVDGDSISVYVNDVLVVSAIRLTTVANKRMIAIPANGDTRITLVAENLGTIPPNTGLMTVKDGDEVYQVNFSADMQTNATVIVRRKKN